jgi:hypothetical protein
MGERVLMTDVQLGGGTLVAALMHDADHGYKQGWSFANSLVAAAEQEARQSDTAASASLTIEGAILARDALLAVINEHIPSLDEETEELLVEMAVDIGNNDVSDLAKRTCACGEEIDGFYDYVSHLRQVFSER